MKTVFLMALCGLSFFACSATEAQMKSLPVVERVDIQRYLGLWYEIARYPNSFQKDCYHSTAEYSLREDGDIRVINRCRKGSPEGEEDLAEGKAWVVDAKSQAKLKVRFFWPFSGNYWILDLGPDYEYAVVGEPKRKYFWILARQRPMDESIFGAILEKMPCWGYDPARLIKQ